MYYYYHSFVGWLLMSLHMVIPLLFIVLLVSFFNKKQGGNIGDQSRTPLGTLKERYARGEINRDEFYHMKDEING